LSQKGADHPGWWRLDLEQRVVGEGGRTKRGEGDQKEKPQKSGEKSEMRTRA